MKKSTRDRASGRYAYSAMEVLCVCGHRLGVHSAAVVDGMRPCFVDEADPNAEHCSCERFRKPRARKQ